MKSSKAILVVLLLLMLAGGLAWEFWPAASSMPKEKPIAAKPNVTKLAPTPAKVAAVEAPRLAPAPPADAPDSEHRYIPGYYAEIEKELLADRARQQQMIQDMEAVPPSDFGEVAVTDGVEIVRTLSTGEKCTIMPHVLVDNRVVEGRNASQIILDMTITDFSGKTISSPKLTVLQGTEVKISVTPVFRIGITPYLAGEKPPSAQKNPASPPHANPFAP